MNVSAAPFCILKYQVSFNPPSWESACDVNGRQLRFCIRESWNIQAPESYQKTEQGKHRQGEQGVQRWFQSRSEMRSETQMQAVETEAKEQWWISLVNDLCTWRTTYSWGFRIARHWKLSRITGKTLQVLETFPPCQWVQRFFDFWLIFRKTKCYQFPSGSLIPLNCFFKSD